MPDRIDELEQRIARIERRLSRLEQQSPETETAAGDEPELPDIGDGFMANASVLVGRVLLIFGGAYLLRAITEYGIVPTGLGLSIGAAYALFWLYRAFAIGREPANRSTALFYGGASVLLAMPLLAESAGRFAVLTGGQALVALSILSLLYLGVAVARDLRLLSWALVPGAAATAFAVLQASHAAVPFTAFLILLGTLALWTCYLKGWNGPQWLGAVGAVIGVLVLTVLTQSERWNVDVLSALAAGSVLLLVYLVSFAIRTHVQRHAIGALESLLTLAAVAVTLFAAFGALRSNALTAATIGAPALLLAAGLYALAFARRTRTERGRDFYFYSTLGVLLFVVGSGLVLTPIAAAAVWSVLAVVLAWLSGHYARVSLSLQCTFLLIAAGVGSGLLETGLVALAGGMPESWPPFERWHVLVALATVACLFIPVAQQSERWGKLAGLPQLIVLALSVWEVGGLIVVVVAPLLVDFDAGEPSRAVLAALRTAVLAAASVTLALSSRLPRWPEARWLVYPVLVLVGIKLFAEDFPHGQPVTLFVALALVGSALILVARLLGPARTPE